VSIITSTAKGLFAKPSRSAGEQETDCAALRCAAWVPVPAKGAIAPPTPYEARSTTVRVLQYCPRLASPPLCPLALDSSWVWSLDCTCPPSGHSGASRKCSPGPQGLHLQAGAGFFYRQVTSNRWCSVPIYRSALPVTGR
jgi:hypothetical protein